MELNADQTGIFVEGVGVTIDSLFDGAAKNRDKLRATNHTTSCCLSIIGSSSLPYTSKWGCVVYLGVLEGS